MANESMKDEEFGLVALLHEIDRHSYTNDVAVFRKTDRHSGHAWRVNALVYFSFTRVS